MTRYLLSSALTDNDLAEFIGKTDDLALADSAFRELERRFQGRMAAEISQHPALYRDQGNALQEMRLALFRAARRFDPRRGVKFSTYIKHDVHGAICAATRQLGQPYSELEEATAVTEGDDQSDLDHIACIEALVASLTPRERSVLAGLYEERSVSEIAALLKLAKSTVSETVGRIRRKALFVGLHPMSA